MMKAKTPFLVGLLMLLGAGAFIITFGSLDKSMSLENAQDIEAVFDDASGLVEGSRVMMSGISVGEIKSIALDKEDPSKARVILRVMPEITLFEGVQDPSTEAWKNGASAARVQASLLGDYYIALTPGIAGRKLESGDALTHVVTKSGLEAVLDRIEKSADVVFPNLERISADIASVTTSMNNSFGGDEGTEALLQIRKDIQTTTNEVASLSKEVRGFVNNSVMSQGPAIERIISNVEDTTASLKTAARRADRKLDGILDNVDATTGDLRAFMERQTAESTEDGTINAAIVKADRGLGVLEGTLENSRSISAKIDQGVGTIGRLVNDERLMDEVEGVVSDVRELTSTFSRLQVKIEFRSEYLILQNSFKSYINISFYPKPDKYYFLQIVDDPRGSRTTKRRVTTSNDPTKPPVLVEDIVTTESKLKFTAQMAKRWHFLTVRYGLMESTGGWGIDVDLLEDALRFKLDVFEFGRDDWPRMRVLASYEFMRNIYIAAGVDDILNSSKRDYFVGLGVSFTDEELKGVLPFIPTPGL